MMLKTGWVSLSAGVMAAAFFGCGGDDGAKQGTTNAVNAKAVVMETQGMVTALNNNDGSALQGNVISIANTGAQRIVQPAGQALTASALRSAQTSGTVNCDMTGCTYDNYVVGPYTINGGITSTNEGDGKKVTANLTYEGSTAGQTFSWSITGEVTVLPGSIDGSLGSEGTGTIDGSMTGGQGTITYHYTNLVEYNNVTLDGSGVPTGGSIHASWSITVDGVQGGNQAYEGTVTFP